MVRQLRTKRKTANQMQGGLGEDLVRRAFPGHWEVRKIWPDFGLDLHVEVFDRLPGSATCQTRGEHFYVQVKSVRGIEVAADKSSRSGDMSVLTCQVDMATLATVRSMGAAVPALLTLVDPDTGSCWFVCLNDYLDKYVRAPAYGAQQGAVTVRVPLGNRLDRDADDYLSLLARRPKLYAAFSRFHDQEHELADLINNSVYAYRHSDEQFALRYDVAVRIDDLLTHNLLLDIYDPPTLLWPRLAEVEGKLQAAAAGIGAAVQPQSKTSLVDYVSSVQDAIAAGADCSQAYEDEVRVVRLPR
jgi:hypothetical protein